MYLSKTHLKLLKQITKNKIVRSDRLNIKDVNYLHENGLIEALTVDKEEEFFIQPYITEKGKAVLYERTKVAFRANLALFISGVALLVSFLVAFTPFADWSKTLIGRFF